MRERLFARVTSLFHDLDAGMLPISVLFPRAPIAAHRKRDAARAELAQVFASVIAARRSAGASEDDVLQSFIDARYTPATHGGRALTDGEVGRWGGGGEEGGGWGGGGGGGSTQQGRTKGTEPPRPRPRPPRSRAC